MTVELTTLPSGLRVVTHRMDAVETVSLGAWVEAGTRYEAASVNGVSHLLEHMAFKGTARRSAQAIAEEIEAVGGSLNAYTSRESTAYHATVLKEDVALAVDIIADILQHPAFDEAELARERHVVLQEIGETNDMPEELVFDRFQEVAYPDQPMGRTVLGPPEIVAAMPRETLVDYMARHYSAPRMVIGAAGRLDHDAVVKMVEREFDALAAGGAPAPEPARYAGGDTREARALEQMHFVLGLDGMGYHDPDYYAASVASMALGGGMSSRLFQEIRERRGLAYSIYSFLSPHVDSGMFAVAAGTGAEDAAELAEVLCDELSRAADGMEEAELARARAQLRAGIVMSLESSASRAEQLARQVMVYGAPMEIAEIIAKIDMVTADDVSRAIRRWLASTPTVAVIGPLGGLPGYDVIAAALRAA
jgi:predicted Zn-dependent peptidase